MKAFTLLYTAAMLLFCVIFFAACKNEGQLDRARTDLEERFEKLSGEEKMVLGMSAGKAKSVPSYQEHYLRYPEEMMRDVMPESEISRYFPGMVPRKFGIRVFNVDIGDGVTLSRDQDVNEDMVGMGINSTHVEKLTESGDVLRIALNPYGYVMFTMGKAFSNHAKTMASNYGRDIVVTGADALGQKLIDNRDLITQSMVDSATKWMQSKEGNEFQKRLIDQSMQALKENSFDIGFQMGLGQFLSTQAASMVMGWVGSMLGQKDPQMEMLRNILDVVVQIRAMVSHVIDMLVDMKIHISVIHDAVYSIPITTAFNEIDGYQTGFMNFIRSDMPVEARRLAQNVLEQGRIPGLISDIYLFGQSKINATRQNRLNEAEPDFYGRIKIADRTCRCSPCLFWCGPPCPDTCTDEVWQDYHFYFPGDVGMISYVDYQLYMKAVQYKIAFIDQAYGNDVTAVRLKGVNARLFREMLIALRDGLDESFKNDILDLRDAYVAKQYNGFVGTSRETLGEDMDSFIRDRYSYVPEYAASIEAMISFCNGLILAEEATY